jgi:signal transduction histidine kinase
MWAPGSGPYATGVITRMRAGLAANPLAVDAFIALALATLSMLALIGGASDAGGREPLSVFLLLMESLPLVFRRKWPVAVLAVTFGATILHAYLATGDSLNEGLGSLVALFTVAERTERRVSVTAALVVAATFTALALSKVGASAAFSGLVSTLVAVAVVWALGDWVRTRRRYLAAIEESARLLEADHEERDRRALQDERDRIARELHDIVTHHVSVIVIQAGAGLTALDQRPAQTRTALEAIDRTSRQALTDMRRMLGILGEPEAAADSSREPQPGLARLGELIEEVRAAGLPVELAVEGERRPLDDGIELSAYRIVQEALTNTLKHARGARARVRLGYEPRALEIEVTDQGGAGKRDLGEAGAGGRGLIGMRERVALFGGDLEAGPMTGGFRVHARLPLEPGPAASA